MNVPDQVKYQNMSRQDRLKPNIYVGVIRDYVAHLRDKWIPKTKEMDSDDGEMFTMYYDEYHDVWTTEDIAFKGHVFKKVSRIINK